MSKITMIDKALFLKRTRLFATLELDLLLAIADKLNIVSYDADEVIFNSGEEASRMFFIVRGEVELIHNSTEISLEEGQFFGDESLFNEKPRAYKAKCRTDALLFSLSKTNLLNIISECPAVAVGFLQIYTDVYPFRNR